MALHVRLPAARRAEAQLAVWTLEGLGPRVQTHVDLQAALGGEGVAAHMAAEELLTCGGARGQSQAHRQWLEGAGTGPPLPAAQHTEW